MVKIDIIKNKSKLSIVTLNSNLPEDHISRFVVDFIEEVYPSLNIKKTKNKKGREPFPIDSKLKLLVYSKIEHVESAKYITDRAKYHEVYKLFLMTYNHQNTQFKDIEESTDLTLKY